MMDTLFYSELRKVGKEITDSIDSSKANSVAMCVSNILNCSYVARKEGLMGLDTWASEHDKEILSEMLSFIIDGAESDFIKDIFFSRYFVNNYEGYEALNYLLSLVGVLEIQSGTNTKVLEKKLKAMLPFHILECFSDIK